MLCDIFVSAPAKVNIGLKVLPKREDGFHNIESIFQTVPLSDELYVRLLGDDECKCEIECEDMVLPEINTLSATYDAFCSLTGNKKSVFVKLKKNIPSGGGLGGGSSDAASFLKALCMLTKVELSDELADNVASKVGSDVFFFLHCYGFSEKIGCALVEGRGEIVKPIKPRSDLHFILLFPGVSSSTKEAYSLVDESFASGKETICPDFQDLEKIYNENPEKWTFKNTFTPCLEKKYPKISDALNDIQKTPVAWTEMSGSGSTVFGIYSSSENMKLAFESLKKKWDCICF